MDIAEFEPIGGFAALIGVEPQEICRAGGI
jgi:hypothetical protein